MELPTLTPLKKEISPKKKGDFGYEEAMALIAEEIEREKEKKLQEDRRKFSQTRQTGTYFKGTQFTAKEPQQRM